MSTISLHTIHLIETKAPIGAEEYTKELDSAAELMEKDIIEYIF